MYVGKIPSIYLGVHVSRIDDSVCVYTKSGGKS